MAAEDRGGRALGLIVPVVQGFVADHTNLLSSFWIPVFCYLYIVYFGLIGHKADD